MGTSDEALLALYIFWSELLILVKYKLKVS